MSPASDAAKRNRQRRSSARSNSGSCLAESGVVSCATAILVSESKGANDLSLSLVVTYFFNCPKHKDTHTHATTYNTKEGSQIGAISCRDTLVDPRQRARQRKEVDREAPLSHADIASRNGSDGHAH